MQCQKCNIEMRMQEVLLENKMKFVCKKCGNEKVVEMAELEKKVIQEI